MVPPVRVSGAPPPGGVLLVLSLLAGVPLLATALRLLRPDRGLGKFLVRLLHRRRIKE